MEFFIIYDGSGLDQDEVRRHFDRWQLGLEVCPTADCCGSCYPFSCN